MANASKNVFQILFFVSFAVVVPSLIHANIDELDGYWKHRADEALKANLAAYDPHPEKITDDFNSHVSKWGF